jgi:hypothetical protein
VQLVASWIADTNTVAWGVFQQAGDGLALAGDVMALRDVDHAHAVSLALGNFEGTGSRELALGIVDWDTISVYLYTIDQTVRSLPMTMAKLLTVAEDSWTLNANVKYVTSPISRATLRFIDTHARTHTRTHDTHDTHDTHAHTTHAHTADAACGWWRVI